MTEKRNNWNLTLTLTFYAHIKNSSRLYTFQRSIETLMRVHKKVQFNPFGVARNGINLRILKSVEGSDQKLYNQGDWGGLHRPIVSSVLSSHLKICQRISGHFRRLFGVTKTFKAWKSIATRFLGRFKRNWWQFNRKRLQNTLSSFMTCKWNALWMLKWSFSNLRRRVYFKTWQSCQK